MSGKAVLFDVGNILLEQRKSFNVVIKELYQHLISDDEVEESSSIRYILKF